jgi:hypothetical protein
MILLTGALAGIIAMDSQIAAFVATNDGKVPVDSVDGNSGTVHTTLGMQVEGWHTYRMPTGSTASWMSLVRSTVTFGNGLQPSFLSGGTCTAIFSAVNTGEATKKAVNSDDKETPAEAQMEEAAQFYSFQYRKLWASCVHRKLKTERTIRDRI